MIWHLVGQCPAKPYAHFYSGTLPKKKVKVNFVHTAAAGYTITSIIVIVIICSQAGQMVLQKTFKQKHSFLPCPQG